METQRVQIRPLQAPVTKLLVLAVIVGSFCLLYFDVIFHMVKQWVEDPNYSHGFLIPFISGFLIWRTRDRLRTLDKRPNNLGFLVLLSGLSLLVVGYLGAELFTMRFSMIVVLFSLILISLGWNYVKTLFFPMAYLVFMIPLPYILYDSVAFPLQMLAAKLATATLQSIGVPVLREGNIIHLSYTSLLVEEACSGIRSLISLLALTTFYAYLTQKGFIRRGVLILSAIPIAVFANAFRVSATGFLAEFYGEDVAQGFFHGFSGWLIFLFAIPLILCVGKVLSVSSYKKSRRTEDEI